MEIPLFEDPGGNITDGGAETEPIHELGITGGVSGLIRNEHLASPSGAEEFGELRGSGDAAADESPEDAVPQENEAERQKELTVQQQTLIMGAWATVCGNCSTSAYPDTETHVVEGDENRGCGVRWRYISVEDMPPEIAVDMRPDLTYIEPDPSKDGITKAMEEKNLKGLDVVYAEEDKDEESED
jgi:hypothetical protein